MYHGFTAIMVLFLNPFLVSLDKKEEKYYKLYSVVVGNRLEITTYVRTYCSKKIDKTQFIV